MFIRTKYNWQLIDKYLLSKYMIENLEKVPLTIPFHIIEIFCLHTFLYLRFLKLLSLYQNEFDIMKQNIIIAEDLSTLSSLIGLEVNLFSLNMGKMIQVSIPF